MDQMKTESKKVIIIGDSSVGKTSILLRLIKNYFDSNSMPTLGTSFKTKDIKFQNEQGEDQAMRLCIWDTAGQERFQSLTKIFFNKSDAAIIVYDVTNQSSFEQSQKWIKDIQDYELSS